MDVSVFVIDYDIRKTDFCKAKCLRAARMSPCHRQIGGHPVLILSDNLPPLMMFFCVLRNNVAPVCLQAGAKHDILFIIHRSFSPIYIQLKIGGAKRLSPALNGGFFP